MSLPRRQRLHLRVAEAIEAGIDAFVDAFDTDEPKERIEGFLERRVAEKREAEKE